MLEVCGVISADYDGFFIVPVKQIHSTIKGET